MIPITKEYINAKIAEWDPHGHLKHLNNRESMYRVGLLQHNQKKSLDPKLGLYNSALMAAIYKIYGENFMFRSIVSHQALQQPDESTLYITLTNNPHTLEPVLELRSETTKSKENLLETTFPLDDLLADPEEITRHEEQEELVSVFLHQLESEINFHILKDIQHLCQTVEIDLATAPGDTFKEKSEALYMLMVKVSNRGHKATRRGGYNWIITHPSIADIYYSGPAGFAPEPSEWLKPLHFSYHGSLNNRWRMYSNWALPKDEILMGYRGESRLDAGLIYSAHIPFEGKLEDDGIKTILRQGKLTTGAAHYTRIKVKNLPY